MYAWLLKSWFTVLGLLCFHVVGRRTTSSSVTMHVGTRSYNSLWHTAVCNPSLGECTCQAHARWRTAGGAVRMSPRWLLVYSGGPAHKAQRQCALVTAATRPRRSAAAMKSSSATRRPLASQSARALSSSGPFKSSARSWGRGRRGCHKSTGDICWGESRIDDSRNSWRRRRADCAPTLPPGPPSGHG